MSSLCSPVVVPRSAETFSFSFILPTYSIYLGFISPFALFCFLYAVIEDSSAFSRIYWPGKCNHSLETLPRQRGKWSHCPKPVSHKSQSSSSFFFSQWRKPLFFIFLCRNFFPCVTAVPPRIHFWTTKETSVSTVGSHLCIHFRLSVRFYSRYY